MKIQTVPGAIIIFPTSQKSKRHQASQPGASTSMTFAQTYKPMAEQGQVHAQGPSL